MFRAVCRVIDMTSQGVGKVSSMLFIPMTLFVTFEVVMRYFFNKPTLWVWDTNVQISAAIVALGTGWALLTRTHVNVDILYTRFSPRVKAIVDLITSGVFFYSIGIMFWVSTIRAATSVRTGEMVSTVWHPPVYQLRVVVAVGVFLLLIQGISKFIKDIKIAYTGKELGVAIRSTTEASK